MSATIEPELVAALDDARRLGFLGSRPIPEVIAHARGFVRALDGFDSVDSILDLGSGGGVPGLVIAHDRPNTKLTLLDRRAKRTDFLERIVRRLGWQDRVTVVCQDVTTFGPDGSFGGVVARGFGPPEFTLTAAARLVRPGSPIVISEPPNQDRWDDQLLGRLRLRRLDDAAGMPEQPASQSNSDHDAGSLDGLVAVFTSR